MYTIRTYKSWNGEEKATLQGTIQSTETEEEKTVPLQDDFLSENKSAYLKIITVLENQIEQQKKELDSKDKIIASITDRLEASQKLVDQQQQLSLADRKNILELENKIKLLEQPKEENISLEQHKRMNIFSMLFKRKEREL